MTYWHIDGVVEIDRTHDIQLLSPSWAHHMTLQSPLQLSLVICLVLAVEVTCVTIKLEAVKEELEVPHVPSSLT